MEAALVILLVVAVVFLFKFTADRSSGFRDPSGMKDEEILSAIAGQADWLEKQASHLAKFGGKEPHAELAKSRRQYIAQLCSTLLPRHQTESSIFYQASELAKKLESEGATHETANVQAVRKVAFEGNGYHYLASWLT